MVVKYNLKTVHCDMCPNRTSGWSKFNMTDLHEPTVQEIRLNEDFYKVRSGGKYIDLCPQCYDKFKARRQV